MNRKRAALWTASAVLLLIAGVCLFLLLRPAPKREPTIPVPAGAQVLLYPMPKGYITAGYLNPRYLEKNHFQHYGVDIVPDAQGQQEVLAAGAGVVLGTEYCENNLGNIVVIQYGNVFLPARRETVSIIARYYHMLSISVEKGSAVAAGQAIGLIDSRHQWYNHSHIELDTDLEHPFNTPQVAETSSALLNRHPATGSTMLDPVGVLAAREDGFIRVHPGSDCCEPKDGLQYAAWDFYEADAGSSGA